MTTTRDILNRAADLVEQGWCQYKLENRRPDGITEYCVIAALSKAAYGNHDTSFRMSDAYWLLESRIGDDNGDLVNWNNTLGRTQAEVVSLLRTVAAEQG